MAKRLILALALAWCAVGGQAKPARVVSISLCSDQLAMLLAAPGQLVSISHVALDARVSAMTKEAAAYAINHARAEEIYLLRPDLVLAGAYSATTVAMLRRLGVPVVIFEPANSLQSVRQQIVQMGAALGRQEAAQVLLADYDKRLAALPQMQGRPLRAVLYAADGYSSGEQTLAGQILLAAGLRNVATELGYPFFARLPLELVVLSRPDFLIGSALYPGASRAEEILSHPALEPFAAGDAQRWRQNADWVCGTPYVLRAVEALRALRQPDLEGGA